MYFHQFHPHSHPWNRTRLRREHRSGLCTGTRMGWPIPPCTQCMRCRLLLPRHCLTSLGPQMWAVQKDKDRYSQKVTNHVRFWNTVLQKSVYKSFLPSVFLALSDCAIAAHLILRSLSLGKRSNRGRAFRSRSLWRHLNRVWDRCCIYKDFQNRVSRETRFWIAPFCAFQNRVSKQCLNLWLPFIRFCKPQNTVSNHVSS